LQREQGLSIYLYLKDLISGGWRMEDKGLVWYGMVLLVVVGEGKRERGKEIRKGG
jgi:hypothetical protein